MVNNGNGYHSHIYGSIFRTGRPWNDWQMANSVPGITGAPRVLPHLAGDPARIGIYTLAVYV